MHAQYIQLQASTPFPHAHTDINTGSVVPDYEHEYDQPFFEPSTQEEELVCQISELSVPCIPASDVE